MSFTLSLIVLAVLFSIPRSTEAFAGPRHSRPNLHLKPSKTALRAFFLADAASEYSTLLSKYPLVTQSLTGGVLSGVGDVLAQTQSTSGKEEEESASLDLDRTGRFVLKGLGGGLIWSDWYKLSDGWSSLLCEDVLSQIQISSAGTAALGLIGNIGGNAQTVVRTMISVALEQFLACPIVYSLWDIPVPKLLSGTPVKAVPGQVRSKIGDLLVENAKVWTFVNMLVYNIPVEFRVLAMSTADVFWQSVISSAVQNETGDEDSKEEESK